FSPVHRVGRERWRKRKIFFGLGIVCAFGREIDWLALPALAFLIDIAEIHHLLLVSRRRPIEQKQVVPSLRRNFGGSARWNSSGMNIVDDDFGFVLLSPFLDVLVVEPGVVGGNEMNPLKDLERLLCGSGLSPPGNRPQGPRSPPPHGF